eukprot:6455580-Karenia_brevis.AAC.1
MAQNGSQMVPKWFNMMPRWLNMALILLTIVPRWLNIVLRLPCMVFGLHHGLWRTSINTLDPATGIQSLLLALSQPDAPTRGAGEFISLRLRAEGMKHQQKYLREHGIDSSGNPVGASASSAAAASSTAASSTAASSTSAPSADALASSSAASRGRKRRMIDHGDVD